MKERSMGVLDSAVGGTIGEGRESQAGDCSYRGSRESQAGDCSYRGRRESQSGDCSYRGSRESQSGDCSYRGWRESQAGDCSCSAVEGTVSDTIEGTVGDIIEGTAEKAQDGRDGEAQQGDENLNGDEHRHTGFPLFYEVMDAGSAYGKPQHEKGNEETDTLEKVAI